MGAYIKDNDEQEVDVRNVVELQPNVLRDESQRSVFGCPDLVPGVGEFQVAFFIAFGFGDRDVEVNRSVRAGFRGLFTVRGGIVGRRAGSVGPTLLVSHIRPFVKTIDDGDTFPHTTGAGVPRGSPSLSLGGF
jgi:hypothetical protein